MGIYSGVHCQHGDINAIQNSPLISSLSQEWLNTIYSLGKIEAVDIGQVILQEGEAREGFLYYHRWSVFNYPG